MDTQKVANQYRLSQWAKIIQEKQKSGLSIKEFCKAQGMRENKYYYWQRKIREATCAGLAKQEETNDLVPNGWVQLTPVQTQQTIAKLGIEINGCHIAVDAETDPELLKEVCRILRTL